MAQSEATSSEERSAESGGYLYRLAYRLSAGVKHGGIGSIDRIKSSGVWRLLTAQFDAPTRALILATGLPLVDGVFPSVILAGTLSTMSGVLVTAGTIFGGPWMLTIVLSEMAGDSVGCRLRRVAQTACIVIPAAGLVAVGAPTIAGLLAMDVFHVASAAVLFTVGGSIANDGLAELLPAPRSIVAVGSVCSVGVNIARGGTVTPELVVDPVLIGQALMTAGAAFLLAVVAAVVAPRVDGRLSIERFRLGSGIALAVVPLSIAGVVPSLASLAVFVLAGVFSMDLTGREDDPPEV